MEVNKGATEVNKGATITIKQEATILIKQEVTIPTKVTEAAKGKKEKQDVKLKGQMKKSKLNGGKNLQSCQIRLTEAHNIKILPQGSIFV